MAHGVERKRVSSDQKLTFLNKLAYGVGNLGSGIVFQMITSYMMFFATVIQKANGLLIGSVMSASVIFDAVTDPVMGVISDNTHFLKWGRRHAYMFIGTIGLAVSNMLLWLCQPTFSGLGIIVWLLFFLFACKLFMTIFSTPYTALGAEMSDDYVERTSIQAFRTIFFLIGLAAPTLFGMFVFFKATPEYPLGQMNPDAYPSMALFGSCCTLLFGFCATYGTKKFIKVYPVETEAKHRQSFSEILKSIIYPMIAYKDYRNVVLGYMFINIGSALLTSLGMHVFTYAFNLTSARIGMLMAILLGVAVLSQRAWVAIVKRTEKRQALILAIVIGIISLLLFFAVTLFREKLYPNIAYAFIPSLIGLGFSVGGALSLPPSMIADTIDIAELVTGKREEGVFYGTMTLCYKLAQSVVLMIIGTLLNTSGFDAELPVQDVVTTRMLAYALPVGCLIAFLLAGYFYLKYSLTKQEVKEAQQRLHEIRKEALSIDNESLDQGN